MATLPLEDPPSQACSYSSLQAPQRTLSMLHGSKPHSTLKDCETVSWKGFYLYTPGKGVHRFCPWPSAPATSTKGSHPDKSYKYPVMAPHNTCPVLPTGRPTSLAQVTTACLSWTCSPQLGPQLQPVLIGTFGPLSTGTASPEAGLH